MFSGKKKKKSKSATSGPNSSNEQASPSSEVCKTEAASTDSAKVFEERKVKLPSRGKQLSSPNREGKSNSDTNRLLISPHSSRLSPSPTGGEVADDDMIELQSVSSPVIVEEINNKKERQQLSPTNVAKRTKQNKSLPPFTSAGKTYGSKKKIPSRSNSNYSNKSKFPTSSHCDTTLPSKMHGLALHRSPMKLGIKLPSSYSSPQWAFRSGSKRRKQATFPRSCRSIEAMVKMKL